VTSFSTQILYFSLLIGLVGLVISMALITYVIFAKLSGTITSGVTTIVLTVSLFSSLILVSNGILSIYLAKVFDQTKKRPLYIIESIFTDK
jgi:hypothetical protein